MSTIYEIAKEAKVSPKTVSRIMAGAKSRPYNYRRVMAAVEKLGYVRNLQAANLRSGKSGLIGLIVPASTNPCYPWFSQNIQDAALARGYQLIVSSVSPQPGEILRALSLMESSRVEGLWINMSEGEAPGCRDVLERFIARGNPVVIDGDLAGDLAADEIMVDGIESMAEMTRHVLDRGHDRIAFISGPLSARGNRDRLTGFKNAMQAAGRHLRSDWICEGVGEFRDGIEIGQKLLAEPSPPTAIICSTDVTAIGVIKAAWQLGRSVPEDVAVTGFDDLPWAEMIHPALTTIRQPQDRIIEETMEHLISRISGEDTSPPQRLVYQPQLVIRDSS